ncbi:hypothetical protein HOLleu_09035 [Holothuria leucospilota]|uniref:Uncharacterized protein n=1 Tax=Holothuria leucospilota TaxID=206669 RepID=A0A9Q1HI97_HOLLE|nr:hypothetical protein HOLleu_09035 [Holothuria leucospilota]
MDLTHWCWKTVVKMIFLLNITCAQTRLLLQSLRGEVGAGNYSYFKLTKEGPIQLIIKSLEGDADVYVSDKVSHPTYSDYEIQSATYGDEVVDIPSSFKRPVGVAIYGHPFSSSSRFQMDIYWVLTPESDSETLSYQSGLPSYSEGQTEEEESLLWTILVQFLKILLEVLV